MTLLSGSRLGPYELLGRLGAGGMGEVYRARDLRLQREVAVKVLPGEFSSDAGRLKRFEKEARSASALNHPNIVTIYEIESADSVPYIAMELVEGKSLRELILAGPLPIKRVLSIATQMGEGLARAHEAGIVHRDLKPENVMVTRDGRVKVLDFGLAKNLNGGPGKTETTNLPTETGTDAGVVLGTVGYMSPEQASGHTVDFRSDQFSFGSVLYELLTGRRAFAKPTGAQTLAAIIQDEPEPLGPLSGQVPAQLRWLVDRCLSKSPEDRYGSTQDLAVELRTIRDHLSETILSEAGGAAPGARSRPLRRWLLPMAALLVVSVLATWWGLRSRESSGRSSSIRFQQITFAPSDLYTAQFAPDGQTIVYGLKPAGRPVELFSTRIGSRESRPLGIPGDVRAISSTGELAIIENRGVVWGTLRVASLAGGASRELLEDVRDVDWSPDGKALGVVHRVAGRNRVEFPIGRVLYEATAASHRIRGCRVSRDGQSVAFVAKDRLTVVDLAGKVRDLTQSSKDFVWSPEGDEIWFSRIAKGTTDLYAVNLAGRERRLASLPAVFHLFDVSLKGDLLLQRATQRWMVSGRFPDGARDRNLSVRDVAQPIDLTPDGKWLLLNEVEQGFGGATIYVRETDGSDPVRIGDGFGTAISPDGEWVLGSTTFPATKYVLLPRGAGERKTLHSDGFEAIEGGAFLPDGSAVVYAAHLPGRGFQIYVQDVQGGRPRPITPEGVRSAGVVSPDGKSVVGVDLKGNRAIYPIGRGEPRPVPGLEAPEWVVQWSGDGQSLYVFRPGDSWRAWLIDIESGHRTSWREIEPVVPPDLFLVTPDGRSYVHAHENWLADLYLAEGVR